MLQTNIQKPYTHKQEKKNKIRKTGTFETSVFEATLSYSPCSATKLLETICFSQSGSLGDVTGNECCG